MSETLTNEEWQRVQEDCREHIDAFLDVYVDESNNNELREETDEYWLFADGHCHELDEIAEINNVDRTALSRRMHTEARRVYDAKGDPWSVADPVIIFKA